MSFHKYRNRQFSRAAHTYDKYSLIQKNMAQKLVNLLPDCSQFRLLELGAGTGHLSTFLADIPSALYIVSDFSWNMLRVAQEKVPTSVLPIVQDARALALKNFDIIVAGAMVQWVTPLRHHLSEIHGILNPGGHYYCSSFGPENLLPLGLALERVGYVPPQKPAISFEDLNRACIESGLQLTQFFQWTEVVQYRDIFDFLGQLKKLGAGGWAEGSFRSKNWFRQLEKEMQKIWVDTSSSGVSELEGLMVKWQPWVAEISI